MSARATAGSKRRGRGCGRWLAAGALLLVAAAAAAGWAWQALNAPQGSGRREVVIEPGSGVSQILRQLADAGLLPSVTLGRLWLSFGLENPSLKAGEYTFDGPVSAIDVLGKVARGEVKVFPVTLVEGLDLEETAAALASAGFGAREALLASFRDPTPILDLDPGARSLEGYLFPDTYHFRRGTPVEEITATLVRTFRERFDREVRAPFEAGRAQSAASRGTLWRAQTVRELVTLAAIVEKEARQDGERPLIAAVYTNRLQLGMGLYADPTVIYAVKQEGRWDGNLRKADLALDSPYNTYRYAGLPPGPVAAPGLASLRAAATPAQVPYLYFVSRNDGSHVFAVSLAEHNRNVDRWQRQYWRERWARERAERRKGE